MILSGPPEALASCPVQLAPWEARPILGPSSGAEAGSLLTSSWPLHYRGMCLSQAYGTVAPWLWWAQGGRRPHSGALLTGQDNEFLTVSQVVASTP